MSRVDLVLDGLVIAGLVGAAVQAVAGRTLFRSMIMFVVFGFAMALAWLRLGASDLALVEAAIGAGITGALVMGAYRNLLDIDSGQSRSALPRRSRLAVPVAVLAAALVAAIGTAAMGLGAEPGTAGREVTARLSESGVDSAVTATLLVFRGYDTLLEMAVLLVAVLGTRAVVSTDAQATAPLGRPNRLVSALQGVVVPFAILVAGYLLRAGGHAPGGAFQAGAVLAAGCVLLILTGQLRPRRVAGPWIQLGLILAVVLFVLLGYAMRWRGPAMLAMPGTWAIYLLEGAMTLSIALTLALLFARSTGLAWRRK